MSLVTNPNFKVFDDQRATNVGVENAVTASIVSQHAPSIKLLSTGFVCPSGTGDTTVSPMTLVYSDGLSASSFNLTSGIFRAPKDGTYTFQFNGEFVTNGNLGTYRRISVSPASSFFGTVKVTTQGPGTALNIGTFLSCSTTVNLLTNDQVTFLISQDTALNMTVNMSLAIIKIA
jgi:hypothetical protein